MSIPIQTPPARRKVTLRLHAQLHETAQEAVRLGLAATQTAFIEDSIRMRAREVRHARMRRLADEAMGDPGFVADMRATVEEFRHTDQERRPPAADARADRWPLDCSGTRWPLATKSV